MMRRTSFVLLLALAGCGVTAPPFLDRMGGERSEALAEDAGPGDPLMAPMKEGVPPPAEATTAAEFDTTTVEEREVAASAEGGRELGRTVASLGDPTDPGFWLETPLVTEVTQGRLVYPETGNSVKVELRPTGKEPGSGSRISLPAMRVLEAPLTGLPELVVYAL